MENSPLQRERYHGELESVQAQDTGPIVSWQGRDSRKFIL